MDPQSANNNIDPKLKETYDRVMGTTTQPAGQPAPATPAAPLPTPPGPAPVANTATPAQPTQPPPLPTDVLSFQAAIQQPPVPNQAPANTVGVIAPQQSSSLLKILYIIGGIVFFVVYTIVWIKIFNLPLPF